MNQDMNASYYMGPEKIIYKKDGVPLPAAHQILIKVKRTGICGTDLTIYAGHHPRAKAPLIMGHEMVGIVERMGSECSGTLKVGDFVTVNPLLWCGHCNSCISGNKHICETLGLLGIDVNGGFAEYLVAEEDRVHKLSTAISWEEAALCEPLAVGLHAIRSSTFKTGDEVIIVGAGIIGAIIGFLLLNSGAKKVTITDVNEWRLEQAGKLSMDAVPAIEMAAMVGQNRADVVFECSGHPSSYDTLTGLAMNSGEIVYVGIPSIPVPVFIRDLIFREVNTAAVRVYRNEEFAIASSIVSQRKMDLSPFVSDILPLSKLAEAIQIARAGRCWKVVINPELDNERN